MDQTLNPTITVGDQTFLIADLPPETQRIVNIYRSWEADLDKARIEVFKYEAALRGLTKELEVRVLEYAVSQAVVQAAPEV